MAFKTVATVQTTTNTYTIEKDKNGIFWVTDEDGYTISHYHSKKEAIKRAEADFLDLEDI